MFRLRASDLTRIVSGTLITVVVGFSMAFTYLLLQLSAEMNSANAFFQGAAPLVYFGVETGFLALVIFAAYAVLRRKK